MGMGWGWIGVAMDLKETGLRMAMELNETGWGWQWIGMKLDWGWFGDRHRSGMAMDWDDNGLGGMAVDGSGNSLGVYLEPEWNLKEVCVSQVC